MDKQVSCVKEEKNVKPEILWGRAVSCFDKKKPAGEWVKRSGIWWYEIAAYDIMDPFFMSIVSDRNHWMFVASNGGLTCGRQDSGFSLFPYYTVDKIIDQADHSGPYTVLLVSSGGKTYLWEPFTECSAAMYRTRRFLRKNVTGNAVEFEESNLDLHLSFRYKWETSSKFGFVRTAVLENTGQADVKVEVIDGLENLMTPDVSKNMQDQVSILADAYKVSESDQADFSALYSLAAAVIDDPVPLESLYATMIYAVGFKNGKVLLSSDQIPDFKRGVLPSPESLKRGRRGAYYIAAGFPLKFKAGENLKTWSLVGDVYMSQKQVSERKAVLRKDPDQLFQMLRNDIDHGTTRLKKIIGSTDGFQLSSKMNVTAHHFANVMFNDMRGGVFYDGYNILRDDFLKFIFETDRRLFHDVSSLVKSYPEISSYQDLKIRIENGGNLPLKRLFYEYMPLTFSRRHGDPSRPWNQFSIKVEDDSGRPVLYYQGNWRDIFQNWEALAVSYPCYLPNMIAKFVSASTADGYNPYRITREGIDWEEPDPDDPWVGIGYWGDHQLIYLLKLMEWTEAFDPGLLGRFFKTALYTYADVPYRMKSLKEIFKDPRETVVFDAHLSAELRKKMKREGSSACMIQNRGEIYTVNLLEKILVSLLTKVSQFVPGGGIWMNTQRPEWNDANNALVGYGLSVVTLCYLYRYLCFLNKNDSFFSESEFEISAEVISFFDDIFHVFQNKTTLYDSSLIVSDPRIRMEFFTELAEAGDRYRRMVYDKGFSEKKTFRGSRLKSWIDMSLPLFEASVRFNRREDGLYHAYNLMDIGHDGLLNISYLYEMLEGQVAVLSSGVLDSAESLDVLEALRKSALYREDQDSYILYPDRHLPGFLEKNRFKLTDADKTLFADLLNKTADNPVLVCDGDYYRFHSDITNVAKLEEKLRVVETTGGMKKMGEPVRDRLRDLYESVFHHRLFTGRSGTMFAFEGLGSIYWHMVSKLLLSISETLFLSQKKNATADMIKSLKTYYFAVREGIGFNKAPDVYGAFPVDPYSHTPAFRGAQQPGMTGQVKEEILTRLKETGILIEEGEIRIDTILIDTDEFLKESAVFEYMNFENRFETLHVGEGQMAFTFCGVPFVLYRQQAEPFCRITLRNGSVFQSNPRRLSEELSREVFQRTGKIQKVECGFV